MHLTKQLALELVSRFRALSLTLSHPMGEGTQDRIARESERCNFNRRVNDSPSPIGWKRAGERVGVKVLLAMILALFASAQVPASVITNDVFRKDTSGNPIYAQGGGVFKFGDRYYWYGVKYNGAVT